ncbi:MAG: hypothetical protein JST32_23135 [Bacteroidetes bacterium]|nr:hypothetical protein [Bacteroidota bacterium]
MLACLFVAVAAISQVKPRASALASETVKPVSKQLSDFYRITAESGVQFIFPVEFRERRIPNNEDFSFDYAMEMPGREFEVWFQVRSQRRDWPVYELSKNDPTKQLENPDASYVKMGQATASALSEDKDFAPRIIHRDVLMRYHATAGKSYLVSLPDLDETKHYKYALILALQRDHIGRILVVCFTNNKNPDFFKHVNGISRYIRFKA